MTAPRDEPTVCVRGASLVVHLWIEVPARLGDDAFGLHAAEAALDVAFDALDHAALHSSTVGVALARMARFSRLLPALLPAARRAILSRLPDGPPSLGVVARAFHRWTGQTPREHRQRRHEAGAP